jgi:hypothetical protein
MDLFTTFAAIAGGKVPADRAIDGVSQLDFLTGRQEKSNREGFVVYVGNDIFGVKWQNYKMMNKELSTGTGPVQQWNIPGSSISIWTRKRSTRSAMVSSTAGRGSRWVRSLPTIWCR